jgi:hypothetical protein
MPAAYCPGCGKGVSPEARASGRCQGCGKSLVAGAPPGHAARPREVRPTAAAAPQTVRPQAPAARPATVKPAVPASLLLAWGTVRMGLGLTFFGVLLFCLCAFLLFVIGATADVQRGTSALTVVAAFLCAAGVGAAVCLALAGGCMGCAVPRNSGARGWAVAVCALLVVTLVLGVVNLLTRADRARVDQENAARIMRGESLLGSVWGPGETKVLKGALVGAVALGNVCYLLFLRRVARSFRRRALAVGIVLFLLLAVLFAGGVTYLGSGPEDLPVELPSGEALLKLVLAGAAGLGVCYVALIGLTHGAVTRGILKS